MAYFSRLTDIVTCNLTQILADETDPSVALDTIIAEMREGLAGANRSVKTAQNNVQRLDDELAFHRTEIQKWHDRAKTALAEGNEEDARDALTRKKETEDVLAGLEQQHEAAVNTRNHLQTMLRALEGRLSDAVRRQSESEPDDSEAAQRPAEAATDVTSERNQQVEDELEKLRRELGQG